MKQGKNPTHLSGFARRMQTNKYPREESPHRNWPISHDGTIHASPHEGANGKRAVHPQQSIDTIGEAGKNPLHPGLCRIFK